MACFVRARALGLRMRSCGVETSFEYPLYRQMRETVKGQGRCGGVERGVEKGCDVPFDPGDGEGAATVCFGKYVLGCLG